MSALAFDLSQRVVLSTVDGSTLTPKGTCKDEDYWKLIGCKGEVLDFGSGFHEGRVLVAFDKDPKELDLACHNPIPKSLWIKVTDLSRSQKGENT